MAIERKAVRLLILEESQNEAERIVSLFRDNGLATRAQRIDTAEALSEALTTVWDLCIASPNCAELPSLTALKVLQKSGRDLPYIQLLEEHDPELQLEALQLGAQDAVVQGEDQQLIFVIRRELDSLYERRSRRSAEVSLLEVEKRCQLLLESSLDAIAYVHDGMHIYANRAYLEIFGYDDPDDLEGLPMTDLIAEQDQEGFKKFLRNYSNDKSARADFQCTAVTATAKTFPVNINFSPAMYDGEPCVQVVLRTDQQGAELEQKLKVLNTLDQLTGLYNRQHFIDLLNNAAERSIHSGEQASLAYISIDRFASLSAELGLAGTDGLLVEVSRAIKQLSPDAQLARISDAVICILKPAATPEQHAPELNKLLETVAGKLFEVGTRTVQTTLSIGVAAMTEKNNQPDEVIGHARRSSESNSSGNHVHVHDPVDDLAASANQGDISAMIQHALQTNSFRLLFQPVISLRGEQEEMYEVLLRLINPKGEEVPPGDFLNTAIKAGVADRIDRWVLLNSIKLLAQHRAKGHQSTLFVHLSSASLQDLSLIAWLSKALRAARLPGNCLVFQIRETDAVTHLKQVRDLLEELHKLGCRVALGQFGCTLNPFNTLKHLNVDFVKIDGSFTGELHEQEQQDALKEMLVVLHEQSKLSIVPFVESASILSVLWQAGVNYIQGHYLQSPTSNMDYDFGSNE